MLRFSKATEITILCVSLVEIHYYLWKKLETLN